MAAYAEALAIRRRLADGQPANPVAQQDLAIILWDLANTPGSGMRWSEVAAQLAAMDAKGQLGAANQSHLALARTLAAKEPAR